MQNLYHIFLGKNKTKSDGDILIKNINVALGEIYRARMNFDMATGDDNIELAIYELSTAEIKYRNLIKEARRLGIVSRSFSGVKAEKDKEGKEVGENKCG